ncbi:MAG: CHAD domain-containing protein [Desulfocapsaceae bacterium]|jgi:CHAD domain-containing protein|nr:CHAD domain-containing protein [Desulfocapsaceae bacterium]
MPITGPDMLPIFTRSYLVADPTRVDSIFKRLPRRHKLQEIDRESGEDQYYDTFDWRLYRKKLLFSRSGNRVTLRTFSGIMRCSAAIRKKDRLFAWDFEDSDMASLLKKRIDMRALCPLLSLRYDRRNFRVLNRDRKTVAWVTRASQKVLSDSAEIEFPEYLTITSVRGYEKIYENILTILDALKLQHSAGDSELFVQGCIASGRKPLDYGSKFYVELDRSVSVGEAVSRICLDLVDAMEKNYEGVCSDVDSEFLHDFRIAVRRTRSLLSLLRKSLPREQLRVFEAEFKWLGSVTGPLRDNDVYLLKKEVYRNLVPHSLRDGLNLFFDDLAARRADDLTELKKNLRSTRYRNLLESWKRFLNDPQSELFQGPGKQVCLDLVNKIVRKRFNRFVKEGDQISDQSDDGQFHTLRIRGKKFRYLLEFFRPFYAEREIKLFLKHMKNVQDCLGDFNDLSVQMDMLNDTLKQLNGRSRKTILLAAALGSLITRLKTEQQQVKNAFYSTYEAFRTEENKRLIKQLTDSCRSTVSIKE